MRRLRVVERRLRAWLAPATDRLRRALRPPDYADLKKRVERIESNQRNLFELRYEGEGGRGLPGEPDARAALRRREFSVYSQNGDDGILLYLFSRVGTRDRTFVEFGIGPPDKCNSANLAVRFGWSGLLIDAAGVAVESARAFHARHAPPGEPPRVRAVQSRLTVDNIDSVLESNGMKGEIDLLSIDIDGNDYWIWRAIRAVRPRVVVVEYNATFGRDAVRIARYHEHFDRFALHPSGVYHSASLPAMERLGRAKGYRLVGGESGGLNAFFVREDLADGVLPAATPREAWYPEKRRTRRWSVEEQLALVEHLGFERDEALEEEVAPPGAPS